MFKDYEETIKRLEKTKADCDDLLKSDGVINSGSDHLKKIIKEMGKRFWETKVDLKVEFTSYQQIKSMKKPKDDNEKKMWEKDDDIRRDDIAEQIKKINKDLDFKERFLKGVRNKYNPTDDGQKKEASDDASFRPRK